MTHHEKLELMHQHMAVLGVSPMTAAPPAWRLLWRFGVEVRPPLFSSFGSLALSTGLFFGTLWGLCMWLLQWSRQSFPAVAAVVAALCAGTLFGIAMAAYYRHLRKKHKLPGWSVYAGRSRDSA